jgi:molybdopterin converting factor small subunit
VFRPLTRQHRRTSFPPVTRHDPNKEHDIMAIEVRIPTILRSYTGGAKIVEGAGDTLADLLADLDSRHAGLKGRLVTDAGALHRFVNVYVNDEDVRFLGALDAKLNDGDSVTILPAVAGGAFGFAAAAAISQHRAAVAAR